MNISFSIFAKNALDFFNDGSFLTIWPPLFGLVHVISDPDLAKVETSFSHSGHLTSAIGRKGNTRHGNSSTPMFNWQKLIPKALVTQRVR
ncbi:MAG TPA: hypothetical protein VGR14_20005 [Verrucomicrobiae bacterium]|nr:hypothetical protein [Verrucomicrobiae bacterium]